MNVCAISKKELPDEQLVAYHNIKKELLSLIKKDLPTFGEKDFLSLEVINKYRKLHLESLIKKDTKALNTLEIEVIKAIEENEILSQSVTPNFTEGETFGERVSDKIAAFGGSWTFIIAFFSFILIWILINIVLIISKPFDPYPFILLNLILSCLAAIQAPIIMMSQNRQEMKDRLRSEHDYKINLKAELEIRLLNEKIDHLIVHQNKRLLEIQQLQLDYLQDISAKNGNKK